MDLNANVLAGVWISQRPAAVSASQTNTLTGVEVIGVWAGNAIHVEGGSFLTMTNCYVVGNHASGVVISSSDAGAAANTSIAGVNLGKAGAPGGNTLQGPINNLINPVSGVCLAIPPSATGQTLSAEGNIWGAVNCKATAGSVTHAEGCANGTDIGGIGTAANKNTASVAMCTLQ